MKLVLYVGCFDVFYALLVSFSKIACCVLITTSTSYLLALTLLVEVHVYVYRIVIRQDGRIVAEHPRSFGRGDTVYDLWDYVPVLARKLGALRNGALFKDWVLPASMERVRRKLAALTMAIGRW